MVAGELLGSAELRSCGPVDLYSSEWGDAEVSSSSETKALLERMIRVPLEWW